MSTSISGVSNDFATNCQLAALIFYVLCHVLYFIVCIGKLTIIIARSKGEISLLCKSKNMRAEDGGNQVFELFINAVDPVLRERVQLIRVYTN